MLPAIAAYGLPSADAYPQPRLNWQLDPATSALLVHDMQQHFVAPFGPENSTLNRVITNISQLITAARAANIPVFYTAQPPAQAAADRGLLTDFWGPGLQQPAAAAIVSELAPQPGDRVLTKWRYDAFERSDFKAQLDHLGCTQLVICGIYAHIGCITTATSAFMKDIQPFMVADALADFDRERHEEALQRTIATCGIVLDSATVQQRWLPCA